MTAVGVLRRDFTACADSPHAAGPVLGALNGITPRAAACSLNHHWFKDWKQRRNLKEDAFTRFKRVSGLVVPLEPLGGRIKSYAIRTLERKIGRASCRESG